MAFADGREVENLHPCLRFSPPSRLIEIDGVDISKIGLRNCEFDLLVTFLPTNVELLVHAAVRGAISIVPQSLGLFEGTLQKNSDPVGSYQDVDIWRALSQVWLKEKEFVEGLEGGLDAPMDHPSLLIVITLLLIPSTTS